MKKLKIISILFGAVVLVALAIGGVFVYKTQQSLNSLNTANSSVSKKINQGKPFSILLLGGRYRN